MGGFCWHLRETYVKTKKQFFYETTIQKLDLRLRDFMTLTQKDPMLLFGFLL